MGIEIIKHEEYLKGLPNTIVMCTRYYGGTPLFPDDEIRECNRCGHKITVRPYNLIAKELVCTECIMGEGLTKEQKQKLKETTMKMEK